MTPQRSWFAGAVAAAVTQRRVLFPPQRIRDKVMIPASLRSPTGSLEDAAVPLTAANCHGRRVTPAGA